ncbi:MAG TPA: serine hydrolase [Longimicrobiales bacterium]|nr:serine hydrolase [Longimicrobiales bacterium]
MPQARPILVRATTPTARRRRGATNTAYSCFRNTSSPQAARTASLEDLIRFDRALRSGHLLPDGAREMMWQDTRLRDDRTVSYGLGSDTKTHARGHRSAGHSGGYLTTFRVFPGSVITAIVLTNGFLHSLNADDIATAFAAIWDPAIIGFSEPACAVAQLSDAQF